ncbi:hypothetical protein HII36_31925 [Nonomuraea sp. NN258]|uniref:hypothetical protein n=1 Tax=Nonomuraea antri TaxID=2730852 RepID=UPI00156823EC|nr:hypothetical protein [Nonomuraea antri]NRQ36410.1 hypothetical protein [Nonomuraea antri]
MHRMAPAVLATLCVSGAFMALSATPAAATGCRYYYTSHFPGPNGETKGSGEYAEGDRDPEGRVCRNGWWVSPEPEPGPWDTTH